jgi:hypothetical protein
MPDFRGIWLMYNGTQKHRWTHDEMDYSMNSMTLINMTICQITSSISSRSVQSVTHRSGPEQPTKRQDNRKAATRNPTT